MCARSPERVSRRLKRMQGLVHADIPYFDFAISACAYEFPLATALHMDALDPLPI